ncbi:unnamed protein product [Boreogadus saida]
MAGSRSELADAVGLTASPGRRDRGRPQSCRPGGRRCPADDVASPRIIYCTVAAGAAPLVLLSGAIPAPAVELLLLLLLLLLEVVVLLVVVVLLLLLLEVLLWLVVLLLLVLVVVLLVAAVGHRRVPDTGRRGYGRTNAVHEWIHFGSGGSVTPPIKERHQNNWS